ncbi:hypothetical protein [Nocardiopsis baichengensis]|uniref:hypothetical protein n=1 Tax=Nocardiopsis baichengensis TaxID=280240 RepID=UPI00037D56A0|nr:hypothetical protein [Nocardiopsis baichengensis]
MSDVNQKAYRCTSSSSEGRHEARRRHLQALSEELADRGVRCLTTLPMESAPVLYVALRRRTVCVVAAETIDGWSLVGPGLECDATDPATAAEILLKEPPPINLSDVLRRRSRMKAVA